jgi:hypothetical protein
VLPEQLKCQLELVGQAQASHGVRDRRLLGNDPLHVPHPRPGRMRRQKSSGSHGHLES